MEDFMRNRTWWKQVLLIVVACICFIQLAGLFGTRVLVPNIGWGGPVEALRDLYTNHIECQFARWDAGYYLQIARSSYSPDGTEQAFFPLYPMLVRFVSDLSGLSLLWSGLIISVLCFTSACLLLYQWIIIDYEEEIASLSVIWLCCFPMTFFFVSFYACALFLALSIASAYFARRGQFIASAVAISLAGATRPVAFLLAVPFFLEFVQQGNFRKLQFLKLAAGIIIAPVGMLGYAWYLSRIIDNTSILASYTSTQSAEWHRSITWPWITLYDGIKAAVFGTGINSDWFSRTIVWQDLLYAILGMVGAIYSLFRLRLSAAVFLLSSMIFLFANHGPQGYAFWSLPRYVASLFPIYLLLTLLTYRLPKKLRWMPLSASAILLGLLAAWFASGRWVA